MHILSTFFPQRPGSRPAAPAPARTQTPAGTPIAGGDRYQPTKPLDALKRDLGADKPITVQPTKFKGVAAKQQAFLAELSKLVSVQEELAPGSTKGAPFERLDVTNDRGEVTQTDGKVTVPLGGKETPTELARAAAFQMGLWCRE